MKYPSLTQASAMATAIISSTNTDKHPLELQEQSTLILITPTIRICCLVLLWILEDQDGGTGIIASVEDWERRYPCLVIASSAFPVTFVLQSRYHSLSFHVHKPPPLFCVCI